MLSDPDRRRKYDLYGIADDQGFKYVARMLFMRVVQRRLIASCFACCNRNFDEAFRSAREGVEDSLLNWIGLAVVLAVGIIPIVVMQRNRTKPVKKRREVALVGCKRWRTAELTTIAMLPRYYLRRSEASQEIGSRPLRTIPSGSDSRRNASSTWMTPHVSNFPLHACFRAVIANLLFFRRMVDAVHHD